MSNPKLTTDLEIAALLIDNPENIHTLISADVSEDYFLDSAARQIFRLCLEQIAETNEPPASVSLLRQLPEEAQAEVIKHLENSDPHTHPEAFVRELVFKHKMRVAWRTMTQAQEIIKRRVEYSPNEDDFTANMREVIDTLEATCVGVERPRTINEMYDELTREWERRIDLAKEGEVLGLPTGFKILDSWYNGFHAPDLTVFGARPGVGKTGVALTWAKTIAEKYPVLFHTGEMNRRQLIERVVSSISGIPIAGVHAGALSDNQLERWLEATKSVPQKLYIDDSMTNCFEKVYAEIRRMHKTHGIKAAFIDYVQLLDTKKRFRSDFEKLSYISRKFKALCLQLDITIILVAQLNRNVDDTDEPHLGSIKGSGQLEQDADNVIFLYKSKLKRDGDATHEEMHMLKLAKMRHGKSGVYRRLRVNQSCHQYSDQEFYL